jgi:hypothetical protein
MESAARRQSNGKLTYMQDIISQSVPDPAFSTDLAHSAISLFGTIKARLKGQGVQDADELVEPLRQLPRLILAAKAMQCFGTGKTDYPGASNYTESTLTKAYHKPRARSNDDSSPVEALPGINILIISQLMPYWKESGR